METTLFAFFLFFLICVWTLFLGLGLRDAEKHRAESDEDSSRADDRKAPTGPALPVLDDAVLVRVMTYLAQERALAEQFVSQPSVERLHRSGREESLGELVAPDLLSPLSKATTKPN